MQKIEDRVEEKSIENNKEKIEQRGIKDKQRKSKKGKRAKKKSLFKRTIFIIFQIVLIIFLLSVLGINLFFKTSLFQKYKELWVVTAMSTMNHQYLATWFLSDEEIEEIMKKLEVQNNEDSNVEEIIIEEPEEKEKEVTVEKIKGKNYLGYVMVVPDASKVKMVDSRKSNMGTKLTEIVKKHDAIGGINAGGFTDVEGKGMGHQLCRPTIINQKLLFGSKGVKYSLIGLSKDGKLILGKYTYQEAINLGIESAIEFGPYLIVNGKNQITNANSGGIHPRTAIGQKKDGTYIFVVIDGRQPGYSLGTNLLELQNIFNRYEAYNAANLDGGSSSTMCFEGKLVNKTSSPLDQRYLPNAIIVEK